MKIAVLALALALVATNAYAQQVTSLGAPGAHHNTIGAVLKYRALYSVDTTNRIYVTDVETGERKRFLPDEFKDTRAVIEDGNDVSVIDKSGTRYLVDLTGKEKRRRGAPGEWLDIAYAFGGDSGSLFGIDLKGQLTYFDRERETRHTPGFEHARLVITHLSWFYFVDRDGTLHAHRRGEKPVTQLGPAGFATGTIAMAINRRTLYLANHDGTLRGVNIDTGRVQDLGQTSPPLEFIFARDCENKSTLFAIDRAGTFGRIPVAEVEPYPPSTPKPQAKIQDTIIWKTEPREHKPAVAAADEEEQPGERTTVCPLCSGTGYLKLRDKYYTIETPTGNGVVQVDTYVDEGRERCWRCRGTGEVRY